VWFKLSSATAIDSPILPVHAIPIADSKLTAFRYIDAGALGLGSGIFNIGREPLFPAVATDKGMVV